MDLENMDKNSMESERPAESEQALLDSLIRQYACGINLKPEWCIYGENARGDRGVLMWVKPSESQEFIARKMAQLVTMLGGSAKASMTEWNPDIKGTAVYDDDKSLEYILGGKNKDNY